MKFSLRRILAPIAIAVVALFASTATAQTTSWQTISDPSVNQDPVLRPFPERVFLAAADAATTSGMNGSTTNNILANWSITGASATVSTYVTYASITQPVNARTLCIEVKENSGSAITGTVVITGTDVFNQSLVETIAVPAGIQLRFYQTKCAFAHIDTISYKLANTAASDVLRIATGQWYGIAIRASADNKFVKISNSATMGATALTAQTISSSTWNVAYSKFKPASAYSGLTYVQVRGYSNLRYNSAQSGSGTMAASF